MGTATEQVPTQVGRYRILKHLATGGMADVFLAKATGIEGFERHVVLKRIHREHARNAAFIRMFLDEARLAASLHHHNIVQVHDIGNEDGEYFYTMEYVHGEDLRSLLRAVTKRKQKVPLEHVISIVIGAAAGLHYAHEHRGPDRKPLGIVHRDVSPSNIIVDFDGNVKVVDFGIAKAAQRSAETKSGVLKGKVAYMAPEQCRGKQVDRRSDVFALGIVLYELTTARRLFKGESDFETMSAIVHGEIPPPSGRRADLPRELEGIILHALAKEPGERYATAHELRLALEQFAMGANLRTSSTSVAAYMTELFGQVPEPWLVDDYVPPDDLTIDFDGSGSGLAAVSISKVEDFASNQSSTPQSSPLMKARKKALLAGAVVGDVEDESEAPEPGRMKTPTNMSGTPMAWQPQVTVVRSKSSWVVALVAATFAAGGVGLITMRPWASDDGAASDPKPMKLPLAPVAEQAEPPTHPVDPKLTASGSAEPGATASGSAEPAATATGTATPVAASGSAAQVGAVESVGRDGTTATRVTKPQTKKRTTKKPVTKATGKTPAAGTTDPNWNPDELLPD